MPENSLPLISVVIPVYNGKGVIEDCLESLYDSRFKSFEVILIDDYSTDGVLGALAGLAISIIPNNKEKGASSARNLGIREARAGIILLLDADILVPNDFLGRVYRFFQDNPDVSFLQGAYDSASYYKNIMSEYKNLIFSFRAHRDGKGYISFIHSACVAGRSDMFKRYLFDTRFSRREDIEYGLRVSRDGLKIYHDPDFKVRHKKKFNFKDFCRYQFRAASQLVLQRFLEKDKNIGSELRQPQTKFYKRAWFLRPVVSALVILGLSGVIFSGHLLWKFMLLASLASIFILDAPFLCYLYQFAVRRVFLLAPALYLLDGFLSGCGIIAGIWGVYRAKRRKNILT